MVLRPSSRASLRTSSQRRASDAAATGSFDPTADEATRAHPPNAFPGPAASPGPLSAP